MEYQGRRSHVCAQSGSGDHADRRLARIGSGRVRPSTLANRPEWDTDLLFKKPWTLSRKAEFMLGIGPQWTYLKQNGKTANSIAGEVAGDFMFWPSGKHRFGWFLEPAYDYSFAAGHPQSVGMSAWFAYRYSVKQSDTR